MSDEEEIEKAVIDNGREDEENTNNKYEDITGKKLKKKNKSSKRSEKSPPGSISSILTPLTESLLKARDNILSTGNCLNTSPRALMTRVMFLVLLSLIVIGIGLNLSLGAENTTVALVVEEIVEEIITQPPLVPRGRMTPAMEKEFGCRELQCVAQCNGKAKPKCLKSRSCVSERDKICQKRCRKTRCEDRCKNEPHLGYVEREQGLEKCKDACTGPTVSHNICVVKCHVKYKPCKSHCFEIANKLKCDNPKILALVAPGGLSSSSGHDEEGEDGASGTVAGDEEGTDSDAPPRRPKKKSSIPGLDDDDLL